MTSNSILLHRLLSFILHPSAFILLLALLPRIVGLADFVTTDEAYHWIGRVEGFSFALSKGAWAETILTGHPGVTLMWLGSLGLALERLAVAHGWIGEPSAIGHLAWLRFPSALLEALLVPVAYGMLRRLVTPTTAFLAALLWATSPFLIAHSRLLHLDALLASFVTLSVLALLVALTPHPRPPTTDHRWLLLSGIFAGLALLTKGPALILLPAAGLLLFSLADERGEDARRETRDARHETGRVKPTTDHRPPTTNSVFRLSSFVFRRLRFVLPRYGLWLLVAALIVVALWPGLWVAPGRAIARYLGEIGDNGGRPNGDGQFFLGRAVADPGPLFYPVAALFRMTPAMLIGLALLLMPGRKTKDERRRTERWHRLSSFIFRLSSPENRRLVALAAFACFWFAVMTLGPKKFDRYILPAWPALLILAAAGLTRIVDWLRDRSSTQNSKLNTQNSLVLGLLLVLIITPLLVHPYYVSYYNPLFGGGAVAQRTLLIGWGEGMDRVGAYLNSRPDINGGPVASALGLTLQPFVPVPVKDVADAQPGKANYAVVYLESLQRAADPAIYATIQQSVPLARISIHGIDYAAIYQLPRPFTRSVDATFGPALHLRGVSVKQMPDRISVTPSWDVRERPAANYNLFLHLLDASGKRIAQIDAAPGGDGPPTNMWQPGEQIAVPFDLFPRAPLPLGTYQIVLGVYDPATHARLAPAGGTPADPASAGTNALLVDQIIVK